jgi:hypothetical protein
MRFSAGGIERRERVWERGDSVFEEAGGSLDILTERVVGLQVLELKVHGLNSFGMASAGLPFFGIYI